MTENTVQLVSLERLQLLQMIMGFRTTQLLQSAGLRMTRTLSTASPHSLIEASR